jgi:hypothetical protein
VSLGVSRDFGLFSSSGSWTVVQGEVDRYNHYFELEHLPRVRQAVLALSAWGYRRIWAYLRYVDGLGRSVAAAAHALPPRSARAEEKRRTNGVRAGKKV